MLSAQKFSWHAPVDLANKHKNLGPSFDRYPSAFSRGPSVPTTRRSPAFFLSFFDSRVRYPRERFNSQWVESTLTLTFDLRYAGRIMLKNKA